jgi:hypothetical protein
MQARNLQISTYRAQNRWLIPSLGLAAQQTSSRRQAFPRFCSSGDRWPLAARLGYPVVLCSPLVKQFLMLHTTNQPLMLDDGGSELLEERNAASPD